MNPRLTIKGLLVGTDGEQPVVWPLFATKLLPVFNQVGAMGWPCGVSPAFCRATDVGAGFNYQTNWLEALYQYRKVGPNFNPALDVIAGGHRESSRRQRQHSLALEITVPIVTYMYVIYTAGQRFASLVAANPPQFYETASPSNSHVRGGRDVKATN
ncbi:MAG: hypothetical protein ACJ72H_13575 [Candidatus Sulfotelmatobacter sp.]